MAIQKQTLKILEPQLVVTANPQRLTTNQDIIVRSVSIQSAEGNIGLLYVTNKESLATSFNRLVIPNPYDIVIIKPDNYAELDGYLKLYDLWVHGSDVGDRFVVSYVEYTERLF